MRFSRALVAALFVAIVLQVVPLAPSVTAGADTAQQQPTADANPLELRLFEPFDSSRWFQHWGLGAAPWHTSLIPDAMDAGNTVLRVDFPAGSPNGSSWALPTGDADTATLAYRIRFGPTWRPMIGEGGKLPGFGLPARNENGTCAEACGLKPVKTGHYSARASFDQLNIAGSYVYTPDCGPSAPALVGYNRHWNALFLNGPWYHVRQRITMNTPGVPDGRIQAWVDDKLVYDSGPAFCFRAADHPEVHVGSVWMEMYYGGKTAPLLPMWLELDDVVVEF